MRNPIIRKSLGIARQNGIGFGLLSSSPTTRRTFPLILACLLGNCFGSVRAAGEWQIGQQKGGDVIEVNATSGTTYHTLEIDDAAGFRTPVVRETISGPTQSFHALVKGLVPGIDYHVRLDGGSDIKDLRLELNTFTEPEVSCANLRRTWEETGRKIVGDSASRVGWDAAKGDWVVLPHNGPLVGQSLYPVEYYLRPALYGACVCHDVQTLDEVALYYLVMLKVFTEPISALLSRPNVMQETRERMTATDQSARTIPADIGGQAADGELYNVQWLHPAAKLLRIISLLPPDRRTPVMRAFAGQYLKFIVVDQLDRYLAQQMMPAPGGGRVKGRIALWKLDMSGVKGERPWDTAIFDIDLWLMASAAEVLGANANDPTVAPLDGLQIAMLRSTLDTGIRFFRSRQNDYPLTKNFQGQQVGSITFGNGDYTAHPDFDYSGVTTEAFPSPSQKLRNPNAGWDMTHAYRLPVFMRALYENRKATGQAWPQFHDLQLFANQYVYRVFNGDFSRPLFHNFLDGSDAWHRVGYHGGEFGYPPSRYCDQHDPHHPCMNPATIMGWGLLAFTNPDLATLEQALVKLALDPSPVVQLFRYRYYYYGTPFEMVSSPSGQTYGIGLYYLIGDNSAMIAGPPLEKSR